MTAKNLLRMPALMLITLLLGACAPTIHYLGEVHQTSARLDVFYDEKDVARKYKVIGNMTNRTSDVHKPEEIQRAMIKRAQQVGANGIIFHKMTSTKTEDCDCLTVEAKAIKYLAKAQSE